jgi:hypothetical protein
MQAVDVRPRLRELKRRVLAVAAPAATQAKVNCGWVGVVRVLAAFSVSSDAHADGASRLAGQANS